MSSEVLEIVRKMDRRGLDWQFSMQCAPLITGLKLSNLLIIPIGCREAAEGLARNAGLSWFTLRETKRKITALLYHKERLARYLRKPEIRIILRETGYPEGDMQEMLDHMRRRYRENREGGTAFPHEMGVFLGYPADDVRGFMENRGEKFLFSGYWKVYAGAEEKRRLFASYEQARDTLIQLTHEGLSMEDILMLYEDYRNDTAELPA